MLKLLSAPTYNAGKVNFICVTQNTEKALETHHQHSCPN